MRKFTCVFLAMLLLVSNACVAAPCLEWNGMRFVEIPGGDYLMGANRLNDADAGFQGTASNRKGSAFKDELPQHKVSIKAFCIMTNSLTNGQMSALEAKVGLPPRALETNEEGAGGESAAEAHRMTWFEADAFARLLSKHIGRSVRLPTEAEWEYAARGGLEGKHFPWGDIQDQYQGKSVRDLVLYSRHNCRVNAVEHMVKDPALHKCVAKAKEQSDYVALNEVACYTQILRTALGALPGNGYGLENLINNEWEWTSSRYMPYPYKANDGREGPPKGKRDTRVVRGGNNSTETCLGYTALRGYGLAGTDPDFRSSYAVRFVIEP